MCSQYLIILFLFILDLSPSYHFCQKILGRTVFEHLQSFLNSHNIFEKFQSGFKTHHSTETALLKMLNDILLITDSGDPAVLLLLDLTAAFDTVDHSILISRLAQCGIKGIPLEWFRSYLSKRTFSVSLDDFISSPALFTCGVPQGSVLGPILFSIYMLPLGLIFRKHNICFHSYADDTQIYLRFNRNTSTPMESLVKCLDEVKTWMASNFLTFNEDKTEVIIFGPSCNFNAPDLDLCNLTCAVKTHVKNLGVFLDSKLTFEKQINSVVQRSFFKLRLLSKVRSFLSYRNLE